MSDRQVGRRARAPSTSRRVRPVRRATPRLSVARAGAALGMLASALAIYGVGASSAFVYLKLDVQGAVYTDPAAAGAAIQSASGQNVFRLSTGPLQAAIEQLPTVDRATIAVQLPGTLVVTLHERQPVVIWKVGARLYLTDSAGALFGRLGDKPPRAAASLPVIDDRRAASAGLSIGTRLDAADVDAATRLASIVPADVGSAAKALEVRVTDENGFVIRADPQGWLAIFGFYTPSLRTTDLIPGQVRLLRSLLIGREPLIDRVILASATDGTYIPKPTPRPAASPSRAP